MNKLIPIVLVSLLHVVCVGQSTFSIGMDMGNSLDAGPVVVKTNKGFLSCCSSVDVASNKQYLSMLAFDKEGNILNKNRVSFGENVALRYGRNLALTNGNVASFRTLQQYDTIKRNYTTWVALIMLNDLGDTLWTKQFLDSSLHVVARTLIETPDSGLFLIGDERKSATNIDPIIIRVDKFGNELSRRSNLTSGATAIFSVVKHPNGKYYGGGNSYSGNRGLAFVTKMDTNMKPIWSRFYPSGLGNAALLTVLDDGNIVFGTDTLISYRSITEFTSRKQLFKIDTNGIVIWRKVHDEIGEHNYYSKVVENKHNELLVLGRRIPKDGIHYTLTQLTSEGDTIWMHQYAYETLEDVNYISDMVATDDGGVLMTGDAVTTGGDQDVWLLKVDSNGCINNDCAKTLVYGKLLSTQEKTSASVYIVFPNPNYGHFTIKGIESANNEKVKVVVYNATGKIVFEQLVQNTTALHVSLPKGAAGVHYLVVSQGKTVLVSEKVIVHE